MQAVILRYGPAGCPLWPPIASSAHAALLCGEEKSLFCSVTWDASTHGWAAVAVWWGPGQPTPSWVPAPLWRGELERRDLLLVGSWPADWDVSQQPFREALGGVLAFEAFAQQVSLSGRCCVLRNDASAAVAAFRKGSPQSPQLQRCALRLNRAAAAVDVDCLPLHVPGLTLVAEGMDGASRCGSELGDDANVDCVRGLAVSDDLWQSVATAASDAGWGSVTVDAFASESNARVPRFWSRFFEPGSEALDALCVPDWARSECPASGLSHREVVYAFPPSQLVRPAVEKACADRALCVLVVPVAILAPHWNKLLAASVLPRRSPYLDGFLRVRDPTRKVAWSGSSAAPAELAVFACDFGRLLPRDSLPPLSVCPGAFDRRRRHLCGSADDCRVQHRIREALLAQRAGPRPAADPVVGRHPRRPPLAGRPSRRALRPTTRASARLLSVGPPDPSRPQRRGLRRGVDSRTPFRGRLSLLGRRPRARRLRRRPSASSPSPAAAPRIPGRCSWKVWGGPLFLSQPQHPYVTGADCGSVPAGLSRRPPCGCHHHKPQYNPGPHATWDCPLRYVAQCGSCPGFNLVGTRDPAQWQGEILTRAAKSAWLTLIAKHALPLPNCKDARPPPFHL
jgi:hypothetical protein